MKLHLGTSTVQGHAKKCTIEDEGTQKVYILTGCDQPVIISRRCFLIQEEERHRLVHEEGDVKAWVVEN